LARRAAVTEVEVVERLAQHVGAQSAVGYCVLRTTVAKRPPEETSKETDRVESERRLVRSP
jgi:hypothetical protein